jgi:hypothetical protein
MQQRVNGGTCFIYWSELSEINMYRMFGDCSGSVIYAQADSSLQANFKLPALRIRYYRHYQLLGAHFCCHL